MTKPKYNESQKRRIAEAWTMVYRKLMMAYSEQEAIAACYGEGDPRFHVASDITMYHVDFLYEMTKKYYNGRIPTDGDGEYFRVRDLFDAHKRFKKYKNFDRFCGILL